MINKDGMHRRIFATLMYVAFTGLHSISLFAINPALAAEQAVESRGNMKHPGKRIYLRTTCMACHGKDGRKAIQDYPNLAGQNKEYMIAQVKDILSLKRRGGNDATGHPRTEGMRGALVTAEGQVRINNEQIEQVSEWLAGLDPAKPTALTEPLSEERRMAGEQLYKKDMCIACHGVDGKKPLIAAYPFIAGQKKSYIVNQLKEIRDKVRTNGQTPAMQASVSKLSDTDIELLADYLSQIDRNK